MNRTHSKIRPAALAAAGSVLLFGLVGVSQADGLKDAMRGELAIPSPDVAPTPAKVKRFDDLIPRNFDQQPPLAPHDIEGRYSLTLKRNRCLDCHDRPNYKEENAPKISDTHYRDATGKELDSISMERFFCTQCHVPQTDVEPLIENRFTSLKP